MNEMPDLVDRCFDDVVERRESAVSLPCGEPVSTPAPYEAAANAYERVLRIRPDDPHAQFQRAWCLLHVPRRRSEGITAFQSLLRVSPSAAGFFLWVVDFSRNLDMRRRSKRFGRRHGLRAPGTADFHYNYAISLTALRRLEEAADAYQNAAQLNPSDGEAWGNLGAAFAELGRWKDAAPCQERAMRLAPV